tara:strand:- start:162 stop:662 length:501 start_codon:yes stop_codon:yes gene_type:complete
MKFTDDLNSITEKEFVTKFGSVFEKSEWIAREVFKRKPFKDSQDLFDKMINIYNNIPKKELIKILNLHPKLVIQKKLTNLSSKEQKGVKLDKCTKKELDEFEKLNLEYEKRFKFPYIIAVKGKDKKEILNNFRSRVKNTHETEFKEAKFQVRKIASFRLNDILNIN